MNRLEFMQKLEQALADVSEEERQEALQYYRDYLDDAGLTEADQVPESLGTPEKIAESIRGSVAGEPESGSFTERGFGVEDSGNYPVKRQENYYENQASFSQNSQDRGRTKWANARDVGESYN